ncbi:hypothetical protein PNOK_0675300 [Pyrrhoderma noxium]|uniref:Uncharacterized protein n=1 Tax=Pyrrhoderma noxium TaxID=2282107 RepID=A0A286UFB5_9AGAM|nr:hypothetical protein PNOK_0675300 [Pyrrhoderma noxium]
MPVFLNSITNAENLPLSPAFTPSIMSFPQNSDTKTKGDNTPPHGTQTQESRHESTSEPYTWKFHPLHRVECRVEPSRGTVRSGAS